MARKNEKQGYVLYRTWNPVLLTMTDQELGQIFRAIIQYQEGLPITNAPQFFEIIRYSFIQDEQRYNRKCEDNRLNRMIGNLKGLKDDILHAQLDMIDLKDLQAIVEKAKDPELKNTLILELHKRTLATNETHVTDVTNRNLDSDLGSDSDSNTDLGSDSDFNTDSNTDSGSETGSEIGKGVQGEREEPHLHGNYQNIYLTDFEWSDLVKRFGMDTVDEAINRLSYTCKVNGERSRTGHYQRLLNHLGG